MLYGCYEHTIDKKNRVLIPAKIREEIGENIVLFKQIDDKCVAVYSEDEWKKLSARIAELPTIESAKFVRRIYSHMAIVQADTQGRVLIPQYLVDYAGLEKDVCVIGSGNHAEIWNLDRYREVESLEDSDELVMTLKQLGF